MAGHQCCPVVCAVYLGLLVVLAFTDPGMTKGSVDREADFVVEDNLGEPCLLASLNITIRVNYLAHSALTRQVSTTLTGQNVENQSGHYCGLCAARQSKLSISWNNNTFTLNLTFLLQDELEDRSTEPVLDMDDIPSGVHSSTTWSLHQISLSYDTMDRTIFPGAFTPSVVSLSAQNLNLFRTPLGLSYICQTPEVVHILFRDRVDLIFNYVYFLPFGADASLVLNETGGVMCSQDVNYTEMGDPFSILFMVSVCLAVVIIIVTFAYAGSRYVTCPCGRSGYKKLACDKPKDET